MSASGSWTFTNGAVAPWMRRPAEGSVHEHHRPEAPRPPVLRQAGADEHSGHVLRALDRPSIDFHDPDFVEVYDAAFAGVKRVLRTQHHLFMYNASGHGAWEASLTNLLSPGDTILVLESGYFSEEWANMARAHGLEVRLVSCDWRHGVEIAQVKAA